LKKARPSASSRRKGVLRLSERTSGGFLREASPLAGWRLSEGSRQRLSFFQKAEGSELVLKKARPSASFGKLHLWRFPKEAPEVPEGSNFFLNVLREA
jgi:hypothetical protein